MNYYRRRWRNKLSPKKLLMLDHADALRLRADVMRAGVAEHLKQWDNDSQGIKAVLVLAEEIAPTLKQAEELYDKVWGRFRRRLRARTSVNRKPRAKAKKSAKTK